VRRILLLITDLEIGGTPTVVREVATRLEALRTRGELGVDVEVACLGRWATVADQLRDAGVRVTAFHARGALDLPRVVRRLVRLVRNRRIDTVFSFLVHANTVAAVASWFLRDVRFIQSVQTTQPRPRWHWRVQRFAQHCAERVVVPSPSAARVAQEWADVPPDRITIIPNAIDLADFRITGFQPVSSAAHELKTRDTFRIGFIGRLDPVKRIPDLLGAVASLDDDYRLHVFGEGSQRPHLESLVDRLGITDRVTLHGAIARPQAGLDRIDLLVLPSEAEGFGLVLIEAMASGVPVVATDAPGICDVVQDGKTGLLVPVASPDALARAIRGVAEDAALRCRLVENALTDVRERFTWDVVLPQYVALLAPEDFGRAKACTPKPVENVT
jgi:glycosyltransferase involved in cell wall biosynthesis